MDMRYYVEPLGSSALYEFDERKAAISGANKIFRDLRRRVRVWSVNEAGKRSLVYVIAPNGKKRR